MPTHATTHLLQQVRSWLAVQALDTQADADLLERFRRERDGDAFAALLQRHGPLVLRVCGRLLHDRDAVEDAFQATFLVLARQAGSVRKSASLAAWLHGVACRTARRVRDRARRTVPAGAPQPRAEADPADDAIRGETGRAVHEEIDRLPERYRQVIVLCCLEGATRAEAAGRLGVPPGAVKKRLACARGLLRRRLSRRGIVSSAALLAALLEQTGEPPAVQATLLQDTLQAAVSFGGSARAVAAANGAVWTMWMAKCKAVVLVLLALAFLGSAATVLALTRRGERPGEPPPRPPAAQAEAGDPLRDDTPLPAGALARLGTARWHQDGDVFFVGFDRGDRRLITARQGATHRCSSCHRHPFEPDLDGRAAAEDMVGVWDLRSGKRKRQFGKLEANPNPGALFGENGMVYVARKQRDLPTGSVAVSPTGDLLAETGPAGPVVLWDLATGKSRELGRADPQAGLVALAISPDGKVLASLGAGGQVRLHDLDKAAEIPGRFGKEAPGDRQVVWGDAVVFAPSGGLLATSGSVREGDGWTGVVEVWQPDTGKRTVQLKGRARGSPAFGFSPDGSLLAWPAEDGTLRLTDARTGKEVRTLGKPEQTRYLAALAFAPDGKRLATRGYDRSVRLWDVASGREVRQVHPAETGLLTGNRSLFGTAGAALSGSVAFSHDGKLLAAGSPRGVVHFWDGVSGRELLPGHKCPVAGAVFARDGKVLYSLGEEGTVRQWDVSGGRQQKCVTLPSEARHLVLAPDGRSAAFATATKKLTVWDVAAGEARTRVDDVETKARGVCPALQPRLALTLSPDGRLLVRLGPDGTVVVWDVASGRQRWLFDDARTAGEPAVPEALQHLVFAADGRRFAAVPAGARAGGSRDGLPPATVFLWDPGSGRLVRRLDGLSPMSAPVALSPDGRTLATAGEDGAVVVWEIATGKERVRLRTGVDGPLTALVYSPDSALLVGAGPGRTLWCWDTLSGDRLGQRRGDQAEVTVLAFAPDGSKLISGGRDGTLLVWDAASFRQEKRPAVTPLAADEERQCWDDLAGVDAGRAARALARLRTVPARAVTLVGQHVRPAATPAAAKLEGWIKDLDSGDFNVRRQAAAELAKLGDLAEPALKKALDAGPSAEVKKRVEELLDKLQAEEPAPSGERLRELRAVELLERLADPDADKLLRALSEGAAGARLTREARAALEHRRDPPGR
jgi:RNA polymerase sigma factor (sigma-70 family)